MPTAGPFSPSSVTSELVSIETADWTDPNEAAASDDSYATVALGPADVSYALRCTGFGITNGDIPPGSTINGVLVEVEASQDGDASTVAAKLVYGGSEVGGNLGGFDAGNFPFTPDGTDTYWPLGGAADKAGASLTQAMVVDPSFGIDVYFGVGFSGSGSTVSVDHVRIAEIYYTEGGGTAYALTADSGSFTLSGAAANLKQGHRLPAAPGAFTLSGTATALKGGHRLLAGSGSFALSGTALVFRKGYSLSAGSGAFTLNGTAASFFHGYRLAAGSGTFTLSGTAANLRHGYSLSAGPGSFALNGTAMAWRRSYILAAASASFTLGGTSLALKRGYLLSAGSGTFVLTGSAITMIGVYRMATIEVYEMSGFVGDSQIGIRPLLAKQVLTIGSTAPTSNAFNPSTNAITIVSTDNVRFAIGSAPTSASPHEYLPASVPVSVAVSPRHKIIALASTTT